MLIRFFKEVIKKFGIVKMILYICSVSAAYILYACLPYTLPNIFDSNAEPSMRMLYIGITILSFVIVPLLNYPTNISMQKVRSISKQVIFEDVTKKKIMFFQEMSIGKIQELFQEASFGARSLLYSVSKSLLRQIVLVILNFTIFCSFHVFLGVVYLTSYLFYFGASIFLLRNKDESIRKTLKTSADVNSAVVDYCTNIDTIYSLRSFEQEKKFFSGF
ncbi:MAG: ABC transporter transmembrane domain-containing protein [Lachnospiraceae bacterium]|nr:ABC transporter transmembrane domain-containing protein [Lachnospiraceae bacterium]MDY5741629.1 ABC transporter transmembrane domain-containing protein [Lachnospiraceae bacterium]